MSTTGAIVVSGGSRGLGAAIVERLLEEGRPVAAFSRRPSERSEKWVGHPLVHWACLDAVDYAATSAFVHAAEQRFGRIGGLVNNAAVGSAAILSTAPLEDIRRTVEVNLIAPLQLTKLVASRMLKHGQGSIVNISSVLGIRGNSGSSVYGATKAALDAVTRSLAKELGSKGICVNSVAPGYFASDMVHELDAGTLARIKRRTPLGRLATEADIVGMIAFLIREGTFITGQTIVIDGGFSC